MIRITGHRSKWKPGAPDYQFTLSYDMAEFDSRLAAEGQVGRLVWNIWPDRHTVLCHAMFDSQPLHEPIRALGLIFESDKAPRKA